MKLKVNNQIPLESARESQKLLFFFFLKIDMKTGAVMNFSHLKSTRLIESYH
jgi:hypothetical protein